MKGANWVNWVGFTFGWRYASAGMIRWIFGGEPGARLDLSDEKRYELQMQAASKISNKKDQEFFNDEDFVRLFLRGAREAYGQGFEAMTQDGKLMCLDWGFRIEDIRPDLPVQLWYGKQDTHVPLNHGVQIAARLGARAQLNVRDETHASLWVNTMKEAMEGIVKAA
jgi:pimeloyl-ACP methyl ester carboxylesterase